MKRVRKAAFLAALVLAAGCTAAPEVIRDVRELPQDALFYLPARDADSALVSPEYQKKLNEKYRRFYFAPWERTRSVMSAERVASEFEEFAERPGFGHNLRPHAGRWIEELQRNADLKSYPNCERPAVTVFPTDLRILPTSKPLFSDIRKAGEGYPFDRLQQSSVNANTPLFVSHLSKDRAWCYVETPFANGWLPVRDIAMVDRDLIADWKKREFAAVIRRRLPIYDGLGRYCFDASLGAQFPIAGGKGGSYRVLLARPSARGQAELQEATIPKSAAVKKPLLLTQRNIARLINQMIGQPYGWGGMYGERDCSAALMDLFAGFNLWLPRNSSEQARAGIFADLSRFKPKERERVIRSLGIPYLTLLWLKGHVLLYLGEYRGRAAVFHNFWGVRTRDLRGREGRRVVGEARITTLEPGREVRDFYRKNSILSRLGGMVFLIPPREIRKSE